MELFMFVLDMADGKHFPIGNAIKEEIFHENFQNLFLEVKN